jgi:glycosyltransferase involved in cell wall biosynthesis
MAKILVPSASHLLSDYLLTSEGTNCYDLFKHMAKYGYQFEALSPYIRIRKNLVNVSFHQVGSLKISPTSRSLPKYAFHTEFSVRSFIAARKLLKQEEIDIIHHMLPAVFDYTLSSLSLLEKNLKQPFVFGPVSSHYYRRPLNERILQPLTSRLHKKTIQRCSRLIAISSHVRDLYKKLIDEKKISVIPFGIDTELFKPIQIKEKREECSILYAGSLYRLKGLQHLIYALAEIRKQGLKAKLTIVGEGQQKHELVALAEKLGIKTHVFFEGFVPYANMPKYYQQCDIFCFPTLGEPFGKAMIEAMACGKPVIASAIGGSTEIIRDGVNGVLFSPADSEALSTKMGWLLTDPKTRLRMGSKARQAVVERFSWPIIAEKYHQLYSELL